MLRAVVVLDDVERLVALLEALLDEGQQHPVLLVLRVEESTDVPGATEGRSRQPDFLFLAHPGTPPHFACGSTASTHDVRMPTLRRPRFRLMCEIGVSLTRGKGWVSGGGTC